MKKYRVYYFGGQSKYSEKAVDYMMVKINGVTLYAEANFEYGSNKELEASIREQAHENGIDQNSLIFFKS